jgi:hypothetical protein
MIYEFALEPALVSQWHNRNDYNFFDEKFGIRFRRVISGYPKNWKKLVWQAFSESSAADNQNAQMRMTELIQLLWQNAVKRYSTFQEIPDWLERAEAEHEQRPFHAIVATENPRERNFIITAQGLVENGHDLWNIPPTYPIARTAEEIAGAISPLTRLCRHAILIDPYFDPRKHRFRQTLSAILNSCNDNIRGIENIQFELHTSIDRFFRVWERGDNRDPSTELRVYNNFVLECQNQLPELVPADIQLKVVVWKQKVGGENLHNRYLLTNLFGVMFGTGSDEAGNPNDQETDDIVLLEEGQYMIRIQQYTGNPPAFDIVGQPFIISS